MRKSPALPPRFLSPFLAKSSLEIQVHRDFASRSFPLLPIFVDLRFVGFCASVSGRRFRFPRERLERHLSLKKAGQESGATTVFYNTMQAQGMVGDGLVSPSESKSPPMPPGGEGT